MITLRNWMLYMYDYVMLTLSIFQLASHVSFRHWYMLFLFSMKWWNPYHWWLHCQHDIIVEIHLICCLIVPWLCVIIIRLADGFAIISVWMLHWHVTCIDHHWYVLYVLFDWCVFVDAWHVVFVNAISESVDCPTVTYIVTYIVTNQWDRKKERKRKNESQWERQKARG